MTHPVKPLAPPPILRRATWLSAWLQSGCDFSQNFSLQRKVFQVNAAALLAIGFLVVFGTAYLLTGNAALYRTAGIIAPVLLMVAVVPTLNRHGRHGLARWLLLWSLTGMMGAGVWFAVGSFLDLHVVFVALTIAGIALVPLGHWIGTVAYVAVNAGLYLYCEFAGVPPQPELLELDPTVAQAFRISYTLTTLAALFFVAWLGEFSARRNESELERLSESDALTLLPNRRRVRQRLTETIASTRRLRHYAALIFLDLDNFKPLNDTHGHQAGDSVLQEVAARLSGMVREMDLAGRLGGDEFVVLLTHLGSDHDAAVDKLGLVTEKLRALLAEPHVLTVPRAGGPNVQVTHRCTASLGAVLFHGEEPGLDSDTVLARADAAMYEAKAAGRDSVHLDTQSST